MNRNRNGGYSLIEILLAIVLLGAIMVPTCTSLVMSIKINDRTDEMMQAQLAVSSAVETLMAEGINSANDVDYGWIDIEETDADGNKTTKSVDRFPAVKVVTVAKDSYYDVTVTSNDGKVSVTTYIRVGGDD